MSDGNLRIGIIGGSGLGELLAGQDGETHAVETPFGKPSGPILRTHWHGVEVALLQRHGPGHVLNPSQVPYRANLYALKKLGVTHVLASGATGSLREELRPGDLVIADQIIDRTYRRAGTFFERSAVHVEFAEPFCPVMRRWLLAAAERMGASLPPPLPSEGGAGGGWSRGQSAAQDANVTSSNPAAHLHPNPPPQTPEGKGAEHVLRVHDGGTYVCMEGPAFSTRAESHLHRAWGGDLIGMTAMPEAKLAREAEMAYALIAMPTDYDSWRPHDSSKPQQALLEEIIGNLKRATANNLALIQEAIRDVSLLTAEPSAAHSALKLAIWSDKNAIPEDELEKLLPIWGKHFVSG